MHTYQKRNKLEDKFCLSGEFTANGLFYSSLSAFLLVVVVGAALCRSFYSKNFIFYLMRLLLCQVRMLISFSSFNFNSYERIKAWRGAKKGKECSWCLWRSSLCPPIQSNNINQTCLNRSFPESCSRPADRQPPIVKLLLTSSQVWFVVFHVVISSNADEEFFVPFARHCSALFLRIAVNFHRYTRIHIKKKFLSPFLWYLKYFLRYPRASPSSIKIISSLVGDARWLSNTNIFTNSKSHFQVWNMIKLFISDNSHNFTFQLVVDEDETLKENQLLVVQPHQDRAREYNQQERAPPPTTYKIFKFSTHKRRNSKREE